MTPDVQIEFDGYLVGEGSLSQLEASISPESYSEQLLGKRAEGDPGFSTVDDINDYAGDPIDLDSREEVDWVYVEGKREAYDRFDYLSIQSRGIQGVPVKVADLILGDTDRYLIDYLHETITDLYVWQNIAVLRAYEDMGVQSVMFLAEHDCPLCESYHRRLFPVDQVLQLLCAGGCLPHAYCSCKLFPVITREVYAGPLDGHLDIPLVSMGDVDMVDLPVEYAEYMKDNAASFPVLEMVFCNTASVAPEMAGVVAYMEEGSLYVHNSYINGRGPFDYIEEFFNAAPAVQKISADDMSGLDVFVLDGHEVVSYDGGFYDRSTGERVK